MYTSHGHHISGTVKNDRPHMNVSRCGGPGRCPVCSRETLLHSKPTQSSTSSIFEGVVDGVIDPPHVFKTKTTRVEAYQLLSDNVERIAALCRGLTVDEIDTTDPSLVFKGINVLTPHGMKRLSQGDYLVAVPFGWDVVSQSDFESTHEVP